MFKNLHRIHEEISKINNNLVDVNKIIKVLINDIDHIEKDIKSYLPTIPDDEKNVYRLINCIEQTIYNEKKDDIIKKHMGIERNTNNEVNKSKDLVITSKNIDEFISIDEMFNTNIEKPIIIAGPCSIENEEYMDQVGEALRDKGIRILRGGAFKPRTSPYTFQGLGKQGLEIIKNIGEKYDLITISEVLDTRYVKMMTEYVDILQIGSRSMHNIELLKEVGKTNHPVLLKRGFNATVEEFILAAEYIALEGNRKIILCERGIRTFETSTRNTLDISSIPIIKKETSLPIVVDLSHSLGRKDIINDIAKAVIAVGADGIMVEVHPNPNMALSDSSQQLDIKEFFELLKNLDTD